MRSSFANGRIQGYRCLPCWALAASLVMGIPPSGLAAEPVVRHAIHLQAQPLGDALRAVTRQTGASLIYDPKLVQGRMAAALSGQFSAEEAIQRLLQGTGLELTVQPGGVLVVRKAAETRPGTPAEAANGAIQSSVQGTVQGGVLVRTGMDAAGVAPATEVAAVRPVQRIEVTGSRLRRIDAEAALPVNVYSREEIERSGQPSLGRFLSSLNEVSMGQGEGAFSTSTQGQGNVQLRGLPLGSTLVLVNGRRIQAVGSSSANFFNLNLIPLAAVERVEVVPVGSSAVYGGDALAGVVNVILKKAIDGPSLGLRLSTGEGFGDGGLSFGLGDRSDQGSWLVIGGYTKATPLMMDERAFFRDVDFRRFGGSDVRARNCSPGTVTSNTSANLPGLGSTFAAIPATASGQGLTVQSFAATAGQANLCNNLTANGSTALVHGSESLSLHASGQRQWAPGLEAFAELSYVRDRVRADGLGLNLNNLVVPASNAHNPFGTAVRVTARLGLDNGREGYVRNTDFLRVLGGVRGELPAGWDYEAAASVSRDTGDRILVNNTVNATARTAALASADPATALNPFATGRAASDEVLRGIWSDTVRHSLGRKDIVNAFARGPVLELPAGSLEAIVGAELARDQFESIQTGARFVNGRHTGAAFTELSVPLFGALDGARGRPLATLTVAGRRDHYSDFGSASTYQGGLELRPTRALMFRASAATSFKPPTLVQTSVDEQIFPTEYAGLTDPQRGNAPIVGGQWVRTTNRALQPETGRALALGAVWEPGGESGTRLGATAWRVRIDDLIGLLSSQVVLDNEALFPGWVTRGPSTDGLPGPVTRVLLMESNFGFVQTSGLDLEASQSWKNDWGRWTAGFSATRTTGYSVLIAPGAVAEERVGRRFTDHWAPTWKGRITLGLDRGAWSVGVASRYISAYKDLSGNDRTLGNSWIHDLSARLDLKQFGLPVGAARAASLSMAVVNAGNKLPEYAAGSPYYDNSQADWRGRYASLRISVDW